MGTQRPATFRSRPKTLGVTELKISMLANLRICSVSSLRRVMEPDKRERRGQLPASHARGVWVTEAVSLSMMHSKVGVGSGAVESTISSHRPMHYTGGDGAAAW